MGAFKSALHLQRLAPLTYAFPTTNVSQTSSTNPPVWMPLQVAARYLQIPLKRTLMSTMIPHTHVWVHPQALPSRISNYPHGEQTDEIINVSPVWVHLQALAPCPPSCQGQLCLAALATDPPEATSQHACAIDRVGQKPEPYIYRHIRCTYGIFSREITIHTVIDKVYIRFWPTLCMCYR